MSGQEQAIYSAVAVALALQELDRIKAIQCLPTPELLLQRLEARSKDADLVRGVLSAYLRDPGVAA